MTTPKLFLLASIVLTASACSDRVVRSVVIDDGDMRPSRIAVPADTPFELTAAAIGERGTRLSAPGLGLATIEVPTNRISTISPKSGYSPGSLTKTRTEIGPLAPGEYTLTCDCGGAPQTTTIVVGPSALAAGTAKGTMASNPVPAPTTP